MYQHRDIKGSTLALPVGKVLCVGRNYVEHIKEMDDPIPEAPLVFMKPSSALCHFSDPILIPKQWGKVEHETEIAVLIGQTLSKASPSEAKSAVVGFALALDLTLRDMQNEYKQKGYPWEKTKSFDNSCPISAFIPVSQINDWDKIHFSLTVNGQLRQQGKSSQMLHNISQLISHASQFFTLQKGDVFLTGTPEGVGEVKAGDSLIAKLEDYIEESVII